MKQFKRMILASTLMVGLAGFAVSCKYGDDIDDIRKDIESLRTGQIASVESQLSSLQATVNSLSSASDAIKGSVSSLEGKVNSLQSSSAAEIDALKSAIQKLQDQLSSLESSAATKTEVEALQKELQEKLNALTSALDNVKKDLDGVDEKVKNLEGKTDKKFGEIDDRLDDLDNKYNEKFAELDAQLVAINSAINAINGQLNIILEQLKTFATAEDLNNLKDVVTEIQKEQESLKADIEDLQKAVAEIADLKEADKELMAKIVELEADLTVKLTALQALVDANAKNIAANAGNIATNAENIAKLEKNLDNLKEVLALLSEQHDGDIEAVNAKIDEMIGEVRADLDERIADLKADIKALEQKYDKKFEDLGEVLATLVSKEDFENSLKEIYDLLETCATNCGTELAGVKEDIEAFKKSFEDFQKYFEDHQKSFEDYQKYVAENFVSMTYFETTLLSYATTEAVGEAIGKVEGELKSFIEGMGQFSNEAAILDAIEAAKNAAIEAADIACKAAFQAAFETAVVTANLVNRDELDALSARVEEYNKEIREHIQQAIAEEHGKISSEISEKIDAAVSEIHKLISGRLTSVVLIPDLYVGGIEAIEFSTYSYNPKQVVSSATEETVNIDTEKVIDLPSGETEIRYHVSPTSVHDGDIKEPSFVYNTATTRAAEGEILEIVSPTHVEGGVLTVVARKNDNAVILNGTKITTVALRVPIADKHLADGEGEAVVYSDYARIVETTHNPRIAAAIDAYQMGDKGVKLNEYVPGEEAGFHFAPNYGVLLASEPAKMVAKEILYNEPFDLLEMVTGCDGEHNEIVKEELNARGLEFRFAIPEMKYLDKQFANQQQYAKILDGTTKIVATYPNGGNSYGNAVSVGKTPIVRVELVNKRGVEAADEIVDVRYFKIKWVEEVIPEENITFEDFTEFEWLVNCNNFVGHVAWDEFVSKVLATLNEGKGMSYAQFLDFYNLKTDKNVEAVPGASIVVTKYYTDGKDEELKNLHVYKTTVPEKERYDNKGVLFHVEEQTAAQANTIAWFMTAEQIGQVINEQRDLIVDKIEAVVTIPSTTGKSKLTFKFVMKVKLPTLASMNGRYTLNGWYSETVANVYPVQRYSDIAGDVVKYDYDFDALYTNNQFLKNLLPCSEWKVKFAEEQTATSTYKGVDYTYRGGSNNDETREGYLYALWENHYRMTANFDKYGWQAAEKAPYEADGTTPKKGAYHMSEKVDYQLSVTNRADFAHSIITYSDNTGKYVDDKLFKVQVWARLNEWNPYLVHEFDIRFVAPVNVTFNNVTSGLEDMKQNNEATSVTLDNARVTVKDFLKATVTIGGKDGLGDYYGVEDAVFNTKDIRVNLKVDANGNTVVDDNMAKEDMPCIFDVEHYQECLTVDGYKLTWHNNTGFKLTQDIKLYVPTTVKHAWGEVTDWVSVTVKHNSNTN